ncbi:hypothetical protein F5Y13DRAFT_127810 [Hypoxylon sp. FL1857]|nr:hypothetical protein F5Y13DRAFT_127810 [Hypoxylon sp. FL1857]
MKFQIIPATLLLSAFTALADDDPNSYFNYIESMCSGPDAPNQIDHVPCVDANYIAIACVPNGTSPLDLDAHAQCMCHGSYFAEYMGCVSCLLYHGDISQANYTYTSLVLSSASDMLCTGTPTVDFATILSDVQTGFPQPTTGDTARSDRSSGDSAVSLYYTATGPQGPGIITGSATAATKSSGTLNLGIPPAPSTTSSNNFAAPTGACGGGKGVFFAAAVGGALVAAL